MTRREKIKLSLLAMQRHSWEQGTALQASLEMGDMDTVIAMAYEAVNRAMPDGRPATIGVTDAITDPCATGEALEAAARATDDPGLRRGADALRVWAMEKAPRNSRGAVYHLTTAPQFWVDSMYMLPPYLAAIGEYGAAMANFDGYWDALYDPEARLMRHMWDDEKRAYVRAAHWGTGNGWALAALARLIPMVPDPACRERLTARAGALIEGVLAWMEPDGSFHDVVDDPTTFREVNLSQMTAYTLYRGMTDGWLDRRYEKTADLLRSAAVAATDEYGIVHQVCGAPDFSHPGQSPEAQAFALLMDTAEERFHR